MRVGIIAVTAGGKKLAARLAAALPQAVPLDSGRGVAAALKCHWRQLDGFVCIMAAGIVVRAIAPLLTAKESDPAVVVLDEKGRFCISLLAGHLGGANALARRVAAVSGGQAVITTASDTLGLPALDLWARANNLAVENKPGLVRASAALVNRGRLQIYSEAAAAMLPPRFVLVADMAEADVIVSERVIGATEAAVLRPKSLVLGVGCNRGTPVAEFDQALQELFREQGLSLLSIAKAASIDVKADEAGLLAFAERNGWPLEFFSKDEINRVGNVTVSQAAMQAVGAIGVAEPAALLGANSNDLFVRKRKWQNVTMAVARANFTLSAPAPDL